MPSSLNLYLHFPFGSNNRILCAFGFMHTSSRIGFTVYLTTNLLHLTNFFFSFFHGERRKPKERDWKSVRRAEKGGGGGESKGEKGKIPRENKFPNPASIIEIIILTKSKTADEVSSISFDLSLSLSSEWDMPRRRKKRDEMRFERKREREREKRGERAPTPLLPSAYKHRGRSAIAFASLVNVTPVMRFRVIR